MFWRHQKADLLRMDLRVSLDHLTVTIFHLIFDNNGGAGTLIDDQV
jgi:hypothetical protein